ncbi:MAG: hypothetical protein ACOWW1_09500 [archaeon]
MNKKMIYVVFIVAIIVLGVCSAWFLIRSENLQSQLNSFENEKSQLQTSIDTKTAEIEDLQNEVSSKDSKIAELNEQITNLREANLMNVGIGASDHTEGEPPYLHVYGYVCNIGEDTAYNAKIHVTANHINGERAIDTYITIGQLPSMSQGSTYKLEQFITYNGISLDVNSLSVTPEWTTEP